MPRRPHDVRSQNAAVVDRPLDVGVLDPSGQPKPEAPFRRTVFLGLDRAHRGDQFRGVPQWGRISDWRRRRRSMSGVMM
jgi:hypothetical protein